MLTTLFRRFLHDAHPKELEIQDDLDIKWRQGMMAGPRVVSPVNANFEGIEGTHAAYSYVNSLITPGQKGFFGKWTKNDQSDLAVTYHYGGEVKIHMLTEGGIHKEVFLGNPAYHSKDSKFIVLIPKNTYCTFESLSENEATFVSYISVPGWELPHAHNYTNDEMEEKFPAFAEMFHELAKPGVHHEEGHRDHREDDVGKFKENYFYKQFFRNMFRDH